MLTAVGFEAVPPDPNTNTQHTTPHASLPGYHLGGGQVRPQIEKTAAISACLAPKTKKEVRRFMGLAGFFRGFIPSGPVS